MPSVWHRRTDCLPRLIVMRRFAALFLVVPIAAGCSSSGSKTLTVGAARTYKLAGFRPAGPVEPGRATIVAFTIDQPSGSALTDYRTGAGPHTGVHLIIVKTDLSTIIHRHPPVTPSGRFRQAVVFPSPGRYRVIVDAYPRTGILRNFQLFKDVTVSGATHRQPLGGYHPNLVVNGFRFVAPAHPNVRANQASFLTVRVTNRAGRPARFVPWYGALAHAIFFRVGTLDYFHTHVCGSGTTGCTSFVGGPRVVGTSTKPGILRVGVLVPVAGTWRLFLQTKVDGHVLTAPFTLEVR
jgi:hypothetical protein